MLLTSPLALFELHLFIPAPEFAFLPTKHFLFPPLHTQKDGPNSSFSKESLQATIHHP